MTSADQYTRYEICLEGRLEERWLRWFEGLDVAAIAPDQYINIISAGGLISTSRKIRLPLAYTDVNCLGSDGQQ